VTTTTTATPTTAPATATTPKPQAPKGRRAVIDPATLAAKLAAARVTAPTVPVPTAVSAAREAQAAVQAANEAALAAAVRASEARMNLEDARRAAVRNLHAVGVFDAFVAWLSGQDGGADVVAALAPPKEAVAAKQIASRREALERVPALLDTFHAQQEAAAAADRASALYMPPAQTRSGSRPLRRSNRGAPAGNGR